MLEFGWIFSRLIILIFIHSSLKKLQVTNMLASGMEVEVNKMPGQREMFSEIIGHLYKSTSSTFNEDKLVDKYIQ